jgi:hypothetical protein
MVLWLESVYLLVLCLVAIGMLILYVNLEEGARVYKRISLSAFLLFFTHILVTRGTPYLITRRLISGRPIWATPRTALIWVSIILRNLFLNRFLSIFFLRGK